MTTWLKRRRDPAHEVEQEEREPPDPVLDVVAEDPQEQHVAEQVQPAAVQEHAGDHPEHRLPEVVTRFERRRDVRRHRPPAVEEPLEAGIPVGGRDRQLDREGGHAQADQREGDDRCPAGRVAIAERDHLLAAGDEPGDPEAPGDADPDGAVPAGWSTARSMPVALSQTRASGSVSTPGSTYNAAQVVPARGPGAEPVLAEEGTVHLRQRDHPLVGAVVPVDRAGPPIRARGDDPVGGLRPQDRVARRRGCPAGAVAAHESQELAAVGQPHVAVDVDGGDAAHVASRGEPEVRRLAGSRRHRRPVSSAGPAAGTGRRRTGCTGSARSRG